jgi:hypothetical protein
MRRLAPFVGIALSVALGIALAPYIGWILLGAVLLLAWCVAAWLVRTGYRRVMKPVRRIMVLLYHYFDQTPAPPA